MFQFFSHHLLIIILLKTWCMFSNPLFTLASLSPCWVWSLEAAARSQKPPSGGELPQAVAAPRSPFPFTLAWKEVRAFIGSAWLISTWCCIDNVSIFSDILPLNDKRTQITLSQNFNSSNLLSLNQPIMLNLLHTPCHSNKILNTAQKIPWRCRG